MGERVIVELRHIEDVHDPIEVRDVVQAVFDFLPPSLPTSEIVAGYAGMTADASVGMVLACLDAERALQYVPQEYGADARPTGTSLLPREVRLSWEHLKLPS